MVLVMTPALEGLKPQWGEAARTSAPTAGSTGVSWPAGAAARLPGLGAAAVLLVVLGVRDRLRHQQSFPLVTIRISSVLSGNVLSGQENLGAALALDMIVIVLPLTIIYQLLQRRTSRWLA